LQIATGRDLQPGEAFYSVLAADGGELVRQDFSLDGWQGPPEAAVAWWKSSMPGADTKKMVWAPSDVMLRYFAETERDVSRQDLRYVLGLLMVRRRILRQESAQRDESGEEWVVLYSPREDREYRVKVVLPDEQRTLVIQDELERLLFGNAATSEGAANGTTP
jgi:hypothetical protein